MSTTHVLRLEDYRDRRRQRLELASSLHSADPGRRALIDHLAQVARIVGADRVASLWVDEYGPGLVHPHTVLDLITDQPRRDFAVEPLRRAKEQGVPGLFDGGSHRDGWSLVVALGSDGTRSWYLAADAVGPRPSLTTRLREDVMFLAGECSAVVLHRDLDALHRPDPFARGSARHRFTGWPILEDLEGRREDSPERVLISLRFVVGRLPRLLVDDDLALPAERLRSQADAARAEIEGSLGSEEAEGERRHWNRVLDAFEASDLTSLCRALVGMAGAAEERAHLHGAAEVYRTAFDIAAAVGDADTAVDAARFNARALRRLAHWDEARRWYDVARRVAEAAQRPGSVAKILDGLASTFRERGDLAGARGVLGDALPFAEASGEPGALGSVCHGLMAVEHLAGNLEEAMRFGWRAVTAYDEEEERRHALAGLGGVLIDLGELGAAEDAWTVVAHLSRTGYYRQYAVDALSHIAALRGDRPEFVRWSGESDALGWETGPKSAKAEILLYRGLSHLALGQGEEGRVWLHRAVAFGQAHEFDRVVRRAHEALAEMDEVLAVPWGGTDPVSSSDREEVRGGLRALRREVVGRSA